MGGGERPRVGENGFPNIEVVVGVAAALLAARCFSLFRAARAVPRVHERLIASLENEDPRIARRLVRRLGFRSPYAEVASGVIRMTRDTGAPPDRDALGRACASARRQVDRNFQRGQGLDLVAIAVIVGVFAFARDGLPTSPLFWGLGAAAVVLLSLGLVARMALWRAIEASLGSLTESIANRQSRPPPSVRPRARSRYRLCPTCGSDLRKCGMDVQAEGVRAEVDGFLCDTCGYLQATRPGVPPSEPSTPL